MMKKAVKFSFWLVIILVLGFAVNSLNINSALAKKAPNTYNYYYPYFYHYFGIFAKDKNTDNHKIILPTRNQVVNTLAKIVK